MYVFKSHWFISMFLLTQPIPPRIGPFLSTTFPLTPLPLFWCTWLYSMLAELIAGLAKIYFSLSTLLLSRNANSLPGLLHSDVETGSQLWVIQGEYFLHLWALSLALGEPAISLPFQLMKVHFFHQEVFSETAQIFTCSFSCKTPNRLTLLITAQRKQMPSKFIVILDQEYL